MTVALGAFDSSFNTFTIFIILESLPTCLDYITILNKFEVILNLKYLLSLQY